MLVILAKREGERKVASISHPIQIHGSISSVHFDSLIGTRTRSFEILSPPRHFLEAGAFLHTRTKSFPYTDLEKSLINMP